MASPGDTITYTASDGSAVIENVSSVDELTVDYCDGAGGAAGFSNGSAGGSATNVTVDVSSVNDLYIWVATTGVGFRNASGGLGRFRGGDGSGIRQGGGGGGSTEVALPSQVTGKNDAPAICGAGGGGGGLGDLASGGGGARGGSSATQDAGAGTPPPQGGDGIDPPTAGSGYINTSLSEVSGGSTTVGGGNGADEDGEIKISYKKTAPDAPTNLTATFTK